MYKMHSKVYPWSKREIKAQA